MSIIVSSFSINQSTFSTDTQGTRKLQTHFTPSAKRVRIFTYNSLYLDTLSVHNQRRYLHKRLCTLCHTVAHRAGGIWHSRYVFLQRLFLSYWSKFFILLAYDWLIFTRGFLLVESVLTGATTRRIIVASHYNNKKHCFIVIQLDRTHTILCPINVNFICQLHPLRVMRSFSF